MAQQCGIRIGLAGFGIHLSIGLVSVEQSVQTVACVLMLGESVISNKNRV